MQLVRCLRQPAREAQRRRQPLAHRHVLPIELQAVSIARLRCRELLRLEQRVCRRVVRTKRVVVRPKAPRRHVLEVPELQRTAEARRCGGSRTGVQLRESELVVRHRVARFVSHECHWVADHGEPLCKPAARRVAPSHRESSRGYTATRDRCHSMGRCHRDHRDGAHAFRRRVHHALASHPDAVELEGGKRTTEKLMINTIRDRG